MASNHDHHHHTEGKNIGVAFFLNLSFTIIELIGGFFTNSLAILSDALHDLGDSLSLGLAWYFHKLSKKGRDHKYSYGYRRFSVLGAIINSVILIIGSFYIIKEAIPRIMHPQEAHSLGMMGLAVLGIVVNGLGMLQLKKGQSLNEKVVSLHLLEDVLGWLVVLIGSIVIHFTGWYQIDPILSILIACFILINIYRNVKSSLKIVLQGFPEDVDQDALASMIRRHPKVNSFHDLHIWSLDGERNIMTVHIVTQEVLDQSDQQALKIALKENLKALNISHCTIEIECKDDSCIDLCEMDNDIHQKGILEHNHIDKGT